MNPLATFDYNLFVARYPEFTSVSPTLALAYFNEATLYFVNDGTGPVTDPVQQLTLLNMITAHIAQINFGLNGEAPSSLVGRISSAGEGSVSVSADVPVLPGSAAWFTQTKYGFSFWSATAPLRTMRYVPSPTFYLSQGFWVVSQFEFLPVVLPQDRPTYAMLPWRERG